MTIMRNFSPSRLLALGILFTLAACDSAPGLEYEVANPQFGLELIGSDPLPITVSQAQAWSTVDPGAEVTCTDRDNPNLGVIRRSDNSPGTSPGEYTVTYTFENATPVTRKVIVSPDNPTCGGAISINSSVNDLTAMLDIQQTGFDEVSADFGNGWVTVTGNTISNDYDSYGNKVIQVRARRANCPDVIRTLNVTLTDPGDGGGTGDNEAPILNSGEVSVEVGSSTTLDLLSILSAIDPDGDDIDVLRIEQPPAGSFSSLNQEAGTVVYNAPSSPRSRFTVQVTATDGELEGVGNLFIEVVEVPPSCTVDVRQRTIDIGTTRSDQPVDFNYLATTVPVNCTGGELNIRNTRVDPSSINLSALPSQGKGWYRMTNFAGVSNGTVVQATAEAYYTNGNVSGGTITVETEVQIATSGRTANAWCGTRATSNGVLAVRACWADGDYGDLTVEIQRSR